MNIVVTGSSGYIGTYTCAALKKAGHHVIEWDMSNSGMCDLKEAEKTLGRFMFNMGCAPDVVLHLAAHCVVSESEKFPTLYYQNNVGGTLNLLQAMKICGCNNLVFASTVASLTGIYGHTKRVCEEIIADQQWLNSTIIRYPNVAGGKIISKSNKTRIVPQLITAFSENRTFTATKNGPRRSYIHVEDVARANLIAIENLHKNREIHYSEIGTWKTYSVAEVVEMFQEITLNELKIKWIKNPVLANCIDIEYHPGNDFGFIPSNKSKLENIIKSALKVKYVS